MDRLCLCIIGSNHSKANPSHHKGAHNKGNNKHKEAGGGWSCDKATGPQIGGTMAQMSVMGLHHGSAFKG